MIANLHMLGVLVFSLIYVGSGDKQGLEAQCNLTRSKAERTHRRIQSYRIRENNYILKREPSQVLICVHYFILTGRLLYKEGCLLALCITLHSSNAI